MSSDNYKGKQGRESNQSGRGGEVNTLHAPYNHLAEEAVIGSLMLDRDAIISVAPYLRPEDFHSEPLGAIYGAILGMFERRVPCDPVLLYAELERLDLLDLIGGMAYVMDITNRTPTACHIKYYAQLVIEAAVRRALISAGGAIAGMGYSDDSDVTDLMARAQAQLAQLYNRAGPDESVSSEELANQFADRMDYLLQNEGAGLGIPTGFTDLDKITGGLHHGNLIVVAARPGMGKTSIALNMTLNMIRQGKRGGGKYSIGIYSLEMTNDEIHRKLVSIRTSIPTDKLKSADLNMEELAAQAEANGFLAAGNYRVDDKSSMTITELVARATRLKAERGLDLVIVDYLTLLKGTPRKDGNRALEVGEIVRGLKAMAKELDIPVLALAQLNREIENRPEKSRVPQLSDLRESGEIEQAADVVIMLHHDLDRVGLVDLHIKKHRNGPTGVVTLTWEDTCTRFGNVAWGRAGNEYAA